MTTSTQSLSERLREIAEWMRDPTNIEPILKAADALDAKSAEIEKWQRVASQGVSIEHELRKDALLKHAILAQAAAALSTLVAHAALHEEYTSHPTDEDVVQISLGELRRARQALAAIRANGVP